MKSFTWRPGAGMDARALERLRDHFQRPQEPMGEAWFMGEERRMFPELQGDLAQVSAQDIQQALIEIASGIGSFGPMEEWNDWFHYLLPQTLPRCHDGSVVGSIVESLTTAYIALYPNGVHSAPYGTFREDTLNTLGRCMMEPYCWDGSQIVIGEFLHRSNLNPKQVWCWWDASGDFSASLFFCLKYLATEQVAEWLRSVLAIPSPHWRAQVIVWGVGAHDMLSGKVKWPSEWKIGSVPAVDWEYSHCLRSDLASGDASGASRMDAMLPEAARSEALRVLAAHFTDDVFLEWLESVGSVPYLKSELGEIPSDFERLYVR